MKNMRVFFRKSRRKKSGPARAVATCAVLNDASVDIPQRPRPEREPYPNLFESYLSEWY
jgi:hypothetical protein